MRWLLLKDLQILRRSPFLVGMLVVYAVAIPVLIGLALSGGGGKPRVAVLNEVPRSDYQIALGGEKVDVGKYSNKLYQSIQPIRVHSRQEALDKVRSGDAVAALIVPDDFARKLSTGITTPQVEVIYNAENPIKRAAVESLIKARLADANLALSKKFTQIGAGYIDLLLKGGSFDVLGQTLNVLGLEKADAILRGTIAALPPRDAARLPLGQVQHFAKLAVDNLNLSDDVLRAVAEPIRAKTTTLQGRRASLSGYLVAVAVTTSLMFVGLLLASGLLALEREEHTFTRLVRGLVSRTALIAEKTGLTALCSVPVGLLMLVIVSLVAGALDWSRFPQWLVGLAIGGLGFAALGVAIGGVAREVRAASLLAFLVALPIAFLALVPSGAVSAGLYDAISVISALFPFKPALQAMDWALNGADPGLLGPLLHMAALVIAYGVIARVALRRFA